MVLTRRCATLCSFFHWPEKLVRNQGAALRQDAEAHVYQTLKFLRYSNCVPMVFQGVLNRVRTPLEHL